MLPKFSRKLLVGATLFTGVCLVSSSPLYAATLSEITLDAVSVQYQAPPTNASEPITRNFSVSVADNSDIDPNLRLTSFTAAVTGPNREVTESNVRGWTATPAPGWQATGLAVEPFGYRFDAISPENGIAPGETLDGFAARSSAASIRNTVLQVTSVSSQTVVSSEPVPEPNSGLVSALSISAVLGTGYVLRRKSKQPSIS